MDGTGETRCTDRTDRRDDGDIDILLVGTKGQEIRRDAHHDIHQRKANDRRQETRQRLTNSRTRPAAASRRWHCSRSRYGSTSTGTASSTTSSATTPARCAAPLVWPFAWQSRRKAKAGEPHPSGVAAWFQCDEYVLGLDVFMDQTALMDVAERRRHANRKSQEPRHVECLLPVPIENAVERFAARVGENKDCAPFMARERQGPDRPCGIKVGCERVFVLKASQALGRWLFRGRSYYKHGRWVAVLSAAVKREFRAIADWFQHVLRRSCH